MNGERGDNGDTQAPGHAVDAVAVAADVTDAAVLVPADPIDAFYEHPVAAQDLINGTVAPPDPVDKAKRLAREDLVPMAIDVYSEILSDRDPLTTSQRLSAARDVLSDSGPFAKTGPPPSGPDDPEHASRATLNRLVSAFAEFKNGTVIAIKDMNNDTRQQGQGQT